MDVLSKFSTDVGYFQRVNFLVELPPGTYRRKVPFAAYTVLVTNLKYDEFKIFWKRQADFRRETLIPKAIIESSDIAELLNDHRGPFTCEALQRNSCNEVGNVGNGVPIIFKSASQDTRQHDEAVDQLRIPCKCHSV